MIIGGDAAQYQIFMRKIGYSVGLENTLERITDLCDVYIEEGHLTLSMWQALVHEKWDLRNDNIGDFFSALNLINRSKTKLDVLSGLDLCAISRQLDAERVALRAALLLLIVEHDGEIFLNALSADFQEEEFVSRLTNLITYKRQVLFKIYRAPEIQAQLGRIVGIERQASNIGGAGKAQSLSESKRTEPLAKRTESMRGPGIPPVEISDDYLRKVLPRRRDWAVSLGLFDPDSGRTHKANQLLDHLKEISLILNTGAVVLWPFSHEISRFRINPTQFENKVIDYWQLVKAALIGVGSSFSDTFDDNDRDFFVEASKAQLELYRGLNRPKAMLRRELPLTVAYLTIGTAFRTSNRQVPNLPDLIDSEKQRAESPLEIRSSRNSIGGILVRPK
jgi:hypothetical protein